MNNWYKLREIINLMKLKINIWTGILAIVNSVVFASSWFVIFSTTFSNAANGGNVAYRVGIFFYVMAGIGVVLNIIAFIQSKRHGISIVCLWCISFPCYHVTYHWDCICLFTTSS